MQPQSQFNFDADSAEDGPAQWVYVRHLTALALVDKLGLPLEHPAEVWLRGGIRLRGKLRLAEEMIVVEEERIRHLKLTVDGVTFTYSEMESCKRLD